MADKFASPPEAGAALEQWRDREINHINQALTSSTSLDGDACARIISALDDVRVRGTVLWDLTQPRAGHQRDMAVLHDVVRRAPDGLVAPVATVPSVQQWMAGDGARANIALLRSMTDDPENSLGRLVDASLRGGMPKSTWRDLMRTLPRDTCRHGESMPAASVTVDLRGSDAVSESLAG